MAKYEKKMMQFEAFRFNGDIIRPALEKDYDESVHAPVWAVLAVVKGILFFDSAKEGEPPCELFIRQPDGEVVHVPVGYYIIRWSDTELYPCEPNLFEASYKPALCEIKAKAFEIAREYGYEPQSRQIIEKMAELTVAINKHWRIGRKFLKVESGGNRDNDMQQAVYEARDRIVEELADVQVMCWQISQLLGAEDGELETMIESKISRELERIRERHAESGGGAK